MSTAQPGDRLGAIVYGAELHPSDYFGAEALCGNDMDVTLVDIDPKHDFTGENGRTEVVVVFKLAEDERLWICNKTNRRTIERIYGNEIRPWLGQKITLYPTTANLKGETVPAIRVRDRKPVATRAATKPDNGFAALHKRVVTKFEGDAKAVSSAVKQAWAKVDGLPPMGAGVGATLTTEQVDMLRAVLEGK